MRTTESALAKARFSRSPKISCQHRDRHAHKSGARQSLWLLGLSIVTVSGCVTHEIETQSNRTKCIESTTVITDFAAPTQLGFSVNDLLAHAAEPVDSTLVWRNLARFNELTFDSAPESGVQRISAQVSHTGGAARFIRSSPLYPELNLYDVYLCPDRVEVDVNLNLTSSSGALQEQVATTLYSTNPYSAKINHRLEAGQPLTGSLQAINVEPPEAVIEQMRFDLTFSSFQKDFGSVYGIARFETEYAEAYFADWPSSPDLGMWDVHDCMRDPSSFPTALDAEISELSTVGVSEQLFALPSVQVTQASQVDPAARVTITATGDRSCFTAVSEAPEPADQLGLTYTGLVDVQTTMATMRIPARVLAISDGRTSVTDFRAERRFDKSDPYAHALSREEFIATYGDPGVVLAGYSHYAVDFVLNYSQTPAEGHAPLEGSLTVIGFVRDGTGLRIHSFANFGIASP